MNYKSLILQLGTQASQKAPFTLRLFSAAGRSFFVIGTLHTFEPTDSLVSYIQKGWEEFLKIPGEKIAIIERRGKIDAQSLEEAIRAYGEAGAVYWFASKAGVRVVCPEPRYYQDVTVELCKRFDPEDVCYRQVGDALSWRTRIHSQHSLEEDLGRLLADRAKHEDIFGFKPTAAWFMEKHHRLFGDQDIGDELFWKKTMNSAGSMNTVFGKILTATEEIRNEVIFDKITELWHQGGNLFMVYGKTHVELLEPALRALIEKEEGDR
jgi:hypothetical protein